MEMVMEINSFLETHLSTIEGWCEKDKALKLYDVIREVKPDLCVEIGVFGGSSLIPQALALKHNNKGTIAGIDPWNNNSAIEEMENFANKNWWGQVDLQGVYDRFLNKLKIYEVEQFCKIIRKKSNQAVSRFDDASIDILHIDGNHCEKLAYEDSVMYYPKVKIGGYIFFDDIGWTENSKTISTEKGLNFLMQYCEKICLVGKDCMVLKKVK
jgi:predicted O-methyltransferase YrrM